MRHIAVIGAGITGVTTAYLLLQHGYHVSIIDSHRYPAMETSFANGGQLSASTKPTPSLPLGLPSPFATSYLRWRNTNISTSTMSDAEFFMSTEPSALM